MNTAIWKNLISFSNDTTFANGKIGRGVWVGTGGTLVVMLESGQTATFANVPDGTFMGMIAVKQIKSTSTASNLVTGY